MDSELVRVEPMTAVEIRTQVNLIQEVMKAVMKKGTHFGTVPGCGNKPTLLKPGAEKLMATFRLAADPHVEDLSGPDVIRYRIKVNMLAADGSFVGAGVGECSSDEGKYMWRKAICEGEFTDTAEDRRREKWERQYGNAPEKVKQVRTNPADVANTVLKMAKKRALVDGVLTATGASDIFTQDIEDIPEEILNPSKDGSSKTSTVKKAEGKKEEKAEPEISAQQKLKDELTAYCNGDKDKMKEVLIDISYFKGNDGNEKFLDSFEKPISDKWAKTSLGKLRALVKKEKEGVKEEVKVEGEEGGTEDLGHEPF